MTSTFWAYALPCLLLPWIIVTAYREWRRWRGDE